MQPDAEAKVRRSVEPDGAIPDSVSYDVALDSAPDTEPDVALAAQPDVGLDALACPSGQYNNNAQYKTSRPVGSTSATDEICMSYADYSECGRRKHMRQMASFTDWETGKMKTNQALFAIAAVAVSAFVGASSCSSESIGDEPMDNQREAIIHGSEDTTHQSVVALMNTSSGRPGWCTATLVAKKGDRGFFLTAAHCVADGRRGVSALQYLKVFVGDDKRAPTATYNVDRLAVHPLYDAVNASVSNVANDFAMFEVSGIDSSLVPIPPMTPAEDNLAAGDELDIIGYGETEFGDNTLRRHIVKPIATIIDPWFHYNQEGSSGGVCTADSGGPALTMTGTPLVAAISAYTIHSQEQRCAHGFSERVSIVHDSFIQPFIDGVPGQISCRECRNSVDMGKGACVSEFDAYESSFENELLAKCITGCKKASCIRDCKNKYPEELKLYQAVIDCECAACDTSCGPTPLCSEGAGKDRPGGKADDIGAGKNDDGQSNASGDENTSGGCAVSAPESGSSRSFGWVVVAGLAGAVVCNSRRRARGKRV